MAVQPAGSTPIRRAVVAWVVMGLVFTSFTTAPAAADERIVTRAEAFVEQDGGRAFDDAFEIHELDSPVVDPGNVATAHARRCVGCRAVALSFQIVLLQQPAEVVRPENLAVSLNEECTSCDAASGAYQFVVGRGEPIRLTPTGYRKLALIRGEVARLEVSRLSGPAIVAKADKLADEVRAILKTEVQPVDDWFAVVIDDRRLRSFNGDTPQQSSTTTMTEAA
jgi:hypothetical protein